MKADPQFFYSAFEEFLSDLGKLMRKSEVGGGLACGQGERADGQPCSRVIISLPIEHYDEMTRLYDRFMSMVELK